MIQKLNLLLMKKLSFLLVVLGLMLLSCQSLPKDSTAFIMSKQFVEEQLSLNLKFPFDDYRHDEPRDSLYLISSYGEAKNGVRINYIVKLKYQGGSWSNKENWQLLEFKSW